MSAATVAKPTTRAQCPILSSPIAEEASPPQPCGDSLCPVDSLNENDGVRMVTPSTGRLSLSPFNYQNLGPPSAEILGIFRRECPGVVLNPVSYPIAAPSTIRQWHPTLVLPSQLRYIRAVAACMRVRSASLHPVIVVRASELSSGGNLLGRAAPAA